MEVAAERSLYQSYQNDSAYTVAIGMAVTLYIPPLSVWSQTGWSILGCGVYIIRSGQLFSIQFSLLLLFPQPFLLANAAVAARSLGSLAY